MPQISQMAATYGGQLFWLLLTFGAIYLFIGRGMVPKIQATVEARDQTIGGDLAAAREANEAADRAEETYRARANAAREEARGLTQESTTQAALASQARFSELTAELDNTQAEAEAAIAERRQAAMVQIESVAAEAAQDIVAKLSPLRVTQPEATRAVEAVQRG